MEDYRRALEATKLKEEEKQMIAKQEPTNKLLLELLTTERIEEFNSLRAVSNIYPNLSNANLSNANLSNANLAFANVDYANL